MWALADSGIRLGLVLYHQGGSLHGYAFGIIVEGSGTQFDPTIVNEFIKREKDFAKLAENMVDEPPSHEDAVLAETRANAR